MNEHSTVLLERAHEHLPFPIFRNVVEYLGLLPKLNRRVQAPFREHFDRYYCRRCGEYITARRSLRRSRKGPFHISCRERFYTSPRKRLRNYHIADASLSQLVYERPRHWFHHQIRCPVLFYSTQLRNYHRFRIPPSMYRPFPKRLEGLEDIFAPIYPVRFEYITNQNACDIRYNVNFSVIPEMYTSELKLYMRYPLLLERRVDILVSETPKMEFMERFRRSTRQSVFEWMIHLKPEVFQWVEPHIFRRVRWFVDRCSEPMRDYIIRLIGIRRIMLHHREWLQDLLIESPEMLDEISEKDIQRFFRKDRKWFCAYVQKVPKALHYITLVHPRKNKNQEEQDYESDHYV